MLRQQKSSPTSRTDEQDTDWPSLSSNASSVLLYLGRSSANKVRLTCEVTDKRACRTGKGVENSARHIDTDTEVKVFELIKLLLSTGSVRSSYLSRNTYSFEMDVDRRLHCRESHLNSVSWVPRVPRSIRTVEDQ
jgi:hypothetical protein